MPNPDSALGPRPFAALRWWPLLLLAGVLLIVAGLRLCLGSGAVGWPEGSSIESLGHVLVPRWLWDPQSPVTPMDTRMLRLIIAGLIGAGLAISGVALQALLRNPLAEPFILGISSGAAVGVLAQWLLSYQLTGRVAGQQTGAILGAGLTAAIVFFASRRRGVVDPLGLLLTGVVLGMINAAIIMFCNYVLGPAGLKEDIGRWMMGYINEAATPPTVLTVAATVAGGLALLFWLGRAMDVATFSDAEAMSLGVNLGALRTLLFVVASVLAAGAVILAGPIGFVGLIAPHVARLMLGPRHRPLLLGSALLGATLVILADALSVIIDLAAGIGVMPVGVFTALIGGPMFLWMLRPQLGRGAE